MAGIVEDREESAKSTGGLARVVEASKAPAIARAAAVMRLLGKADSGMGVHAIARELELVPSTCLHVLRALVAEEFVSFDPDTKRYSLDAGVLTLARHWLRRNRFSLIAQSQIDRIAEAHQVSVLGASIVSADHIVVVAMSPHIQGLQISSQIGSRFPALISATGRCIAAFGGLSPEDLKSRFATLQWGNPPTFEAWLDEVEEVRRTGIGVDEGQYIPGVTVVAAPVWSDGGRLGQSLVAIGLTSLLQGDALERLKAAILTGAQEISRHLSGDWKVGTTSLEKSEGQI
ncbi:IclR family transcriptional regulator [Sphingobium sp. EM0848]|uniref:IclR family transcriptional regulator n=1 Tax=Sphingobium sp. EM0848 TaxID=2743473 RepID=UPI00159CB8E1|nr:IclR family transcriptional regulator [Sphingobium sp. EM0848]